MSTEAISSPMVTRAVAHLTSRSSRSLRSLGHSALRTCSGMASPCSPEQALHAECRLTGRKGCMSKSETLGAFRCISFGALWCQALRLQQNRSLFTN